MAGINSIIVGQGEKLGLNAVDEVSMVTVRKIRAAYASFKQDISANDIPLGMIDESYVPRCVPRYENDIQYDITKPELISFFQKGVNCRRLKTSQAI